MTQKCKPQRFWVELRLSAITTALGQVVQRALFTLSIITLVAIILGGFASAQEYNPNKTEDSLFGSSPPSLGQKILFAASQAAAPSAGNPDPSSPSAEPSMEELAQKANNPLSDVWLLLSQNDTTLYGGDLVKGTKVLNSFKFQPVMPIPIFDQKWNLIFRPVFNIASVPIDKDVGKLFGASQGQIVADPGLSSIVGDPWGRTSGLGDSVLLTLLGPNRNDGFVWGAGVTQIFPTATEDVLGQEKFQVGPAALAVRLGKDYGGLGIENWNFGIIPQQFFSYAGGSDRPETSQMDIQYFINWKMNATQLIGMTPNIKINWRADGGEKLAFPIGLGTIGLFKMGPLPIRWGVEVQYYVVQPDNVAPEWNFKVFFSPIILNPLK